MSHQWGRRFDITFTKAKITHSVTGIRNSKNEELLSNGSRDFTSHDIPVCTHDPMYVRHSHLCAKSLSSKKSHPSIGISPQTLSPVYRKKTANSAEREVFRPPASNRRSQPEKTSLPVTGSETCSLSYTVLVRAQHVSFQPASGTPQIPFHEICRGAYCNTACPLLKIKKPPVAWGPCKRNGMPCIQCHVGKVPPRRYSGKSGYSPRVVYARAAGKTAAFTGHWASILSLCNLGFRMVTHQALKL